MGQEPAPAEGDTPAATTESKPENKPQDGPQTFDKEYVSSLRSEAAKWRTEAQQRQERLDELEERDKSELEKAQAKATKLEQAKAEAEVRLLRFEVATDKQLPKELIPRLRGNSREELEADAEELLTLVKSRSDTDTTPDFDGGPREPAPEPKSPEDQHNDDVLKLLGLST